MHGTIKSFLTVSNWDRRQDRKWSWSYRETVPCRRRKSAPTTETRCRWSTPRRRWCCSIREWVRPVTFCPSVLRASWKVRPTSTAATLEPRTSPEDRRSKRRWLKTVPVWASVWRAAKIHPSATEPWPSKRYSQATISHN